MAIKQDGDILYAADFNNKVDAQDGWGLSQENYTAAEKNKVSNLPNNTVAALQEKQNNLTAGNNISISNNTISANFTWEELP